MKLHHLKLGGKKYGMVSKINLWFAVLLFTFLFSCKEQIKTPDNLPNNAEWIGGTDGGVWIVYEDKKDRGTYIFSIFKESGDLWIKTSFKGDCIFNSSMKLKKQIKAFDGTNLIMHEVL